MSLVDRLITQRLRAVTARLEAYAQRLDASNARARRRRARLYRHAVVSSAIDITRDELLVEIGRALVGGDNAKVVGMTALVEQRRQLLREKD